MNNLAEEAVELTLKQERFCRNYTQNYELYGNSTLSYAEAYGYDLDSQPKDDAVYEQNEKGEDTNVVIIPSSYKRMYDDCSSHGSRLRKIDKIQARCRELLNEFLRDEVVDARLTEIILKGDDKDSIQAIKEYNKLKQRIIEKSDITSGGKTLQTELTDEQFYRIIRTTAEKLSGEEGGTGGAD